MAIKRIIGSPTGIYRREAACVELRGDLKSRQDLARYLKKLGSSLALDRLASEAADFLKRYVRDEMGGFTVTIRREAKAAGLDYVVGEYVRRTRPDLERKLQPPASISQEERRKLLARLRRLEMADDACNILRYIYVIQSLPEKGPKENAIGQGFALGAAYERFKVRRSEHKAWTGNKTLEGARAGGLARKKTARELSEIVLKFRESKLSQRSYARTSGVSRSTLQRALKRNWLHIRPLRPSTPVL